MLPPDYETIGSSALTVVWFAIVLAAFVLANFRLCVNTRTLFVIGDDAIRASDFDCHVSVILLGRS